MVFFLVLFIVLFIKLAFQNEKDITMPSAGSVFGGLEVSCLDQGTPGPQKRSVMNLEENMGVVLELEKRNYQRVPA